MPEATASPSAASLATPVEDRPEGGIRQPTSSTTPVSPAITSFEIIGETGRHPDVICHAITVSNEEKRKSLRPLKAKLVQFRRRHKELGEELQRYIILDLQPGAGHFGQEALAEAEELAKHKHELEREIEKVKIDIAHRERVVTDEQIISDVLLAFEGRMTDLPFDDQRDHLHLMMCQIRVNRLDPENDRIPAGPQGWDTKIRTQWYSVT